MGKTGPCRHCGVTSTPLWRNGPPDKPVLCNACGSRWRTKGSLAHYTPLHARESFELEEPDVPKVKTTLKPKEKKLTKKKLNTMLESEHEMQYCDQNYRKIVEGEINYRYSSGPTGSAVSYSESCAQYGTNDASDMTGSAQSNIWDPLVSSKKKTFVTRSKPSPVEELTKELYSILHEQQSCNLSVCSEDDLLYETTMPMDSSEIGYGSVLIRHPYSKGVEDESEASSFPLEKKVFMKDDTYLGTSSFPVIAESSIAELSDIDTGKLKKSSTEMVQDSIKRNKVPPEKYRMLRDKDSPLVTTSLHDKASKKINVEKELQAGKNTVGLQKSASMKRPVDNQPQNYSELRRATKSPKRVCTFGVSNTTFIGEVVPNSSNAGLKSINNMDNLVEYEGTCSNPRSLFESPQDSSSMQAPLQFTADSSDQDLLVDVPCSASFAEAELLYPLSKEKMARNVSSVDSGLAEGEGSRSSFSFPSFSITKTQNR